MLASFALARGLWSLQDLVFLRGVSRSTAQITTVVSEGILEQLRDLFHDTAVREVFPDFLSKAPHNKGDIPLAYMKQHQRHDRLSS